MKNDIELALIIIVFVVIGISNVLIFEYMYTNSIMINEIVDNTSVTMPALDVVVLLFWIIIGFIIAATR